jgi:hypothetical protein
MRKVNYVIVGCGNYTTNRIIKEGFSLDTSRFETLERITSVSVVFTPKVNKINNECERNFA